MDEAFWETGEEPAAPRNQDTAARPAALELPVRNDRPEQESSAKILPVVATYVPSKPDVPPEMPPHDAGGQLSPLPRRRSTLSETTPDPLPAKPLHPALQPAALRLLDPADRR
jgi:hypothetical protein